MRREDDRREQLALVAKRAFTFHGIIPLTLN
jgi:hypothetical protein